MQQLSCSQLVLSDACVFDEATPLGSGVSQVQTQFGHHLIQVYERSEKA